MSQSQPPKLQTARKSNRRKISSLILFFTPLLYHHHHSQKIIHSLHTDLSILIISISNATLWRFRDPSRSLQFFFFSSSMVASVSTFLVLHHRISRRFVSFQFQCRFHSHILGFSNFESLFYESLDLSARI